MNESDIVKRPEYVQLLLWIIVLAIPTSLFTLIYLEVYERGIDLY